MIITPKRKTTLKAAQAAAAELGFVLEKSGRVYEYWKRGEDHTTGEAATLAEAMTDILCW